MTRGARATRLMIAVSASAAGLIGGHLLDYHLMLAPAQRATLLHQTGHAYLPYAIVGSMCLAILAAMAAGRLGFLRGRGPGGDSLGAAGLAVRLAILQAGSFVALEVVERLAAGSGLAGLAGPLLWTGLVLQLVVAVAGTVLLRLIHRIAEEVGRFLAGRHRQRARSRRLPLPLGATGQTDAVLALRPPRGPPFLLIDTA